MSGSSEAFADQVVSEIKLAFYKKTLADLEEQLAENEGHRNRLLFLLAKEQSKLAKAQRGPEARAKKFAAGLN
jgi:hypothetical protein